MSFARKLLIPCLGIALLGTMSIAQEKKEPAKKAAKSGGRILHPELTVETGTWDKPAGDIGEHPAQPWSATTVAAGVDGKPQPGAAVTKVGEIVDFSCYLQLGKHGEKHRSCGQKCVQNSQPIGLLTRDGTLYMLMPEEHDPRRDGGISLVKMGSDHMGHIMRVHGTEASHMGYRAIFVTGATK